MPTADALKRYLEQVRYIRGSNLATNERSYYPALDVLFNSIGEALNPQVLAIHDVADAGAGHPDFTLQVKMTGDLRAVVEAKGALANVDEIAESEQVRRYLNRYNLCLVTNLHDFTLVRLGSGGQIEELMRKRIGATQANFWREPIDALVETFGEEMTDFLTSVLLWDAPVARPKDLAEALARYARAARREMARRSDAGLVPLRKALAGALGLHFIDDEGEHFFRSSLVQTLFYGLFSAWVAWNRDHPGAPPEQFRWREAGDYLHLPVLRELFEHVAIPGQLESLHIRRPIEWAEATLRRTIYGNFASVFSDGSAVNYFYEPFLEAYDPELREQLGVWYTPREIIQYQVARVDRLLREELGIADGLADDRVIVLDPATGTGGYLLEVLRVIDRTLRETDDATRGMHLRRAATSRVFGFEILPAPFVVAHLQIATLLASLGGALGDRDRPGIYLTNSLTGWTQQEFAQGAFEGWPSLKKEVEAAGSVKHDARILVVLGNPPYYALAGVAEDEEHNLIEPYYKDIAKRFSIQPRSVNDLYVRFFRLAERQIAETTGKGVVSLITNNNWLDALSLPVMREHILQAFDAIWIDNLNGGGRRRGSRGPDGKPDRSAFEYVGSQGPIGITVATAITTMVKSEQAQGLSIAHYRDLWGQGAEKRHRLALEARQSLASLTANYQSMAPTEANRYVFMPGGVESDYPYWTALDELFLVQFPGVKTSRDADLVAVDRGVLTHRMQQYFDASVRDDTMALTAPALMRDAARYGAKSTRATLQRTSRYNSERELRIAYRPFDDRWLYWEPTTKLLDEKRVDFVEQVFSGNVYLAACTKGRRGVCLPTITDKLSDSHLQDPFSLYFPLFIRHTFSAHQESLFGHTEQQTPGALQTNFTPAILDRLMEAVDAEDSERSSVAESLFYHTLAVSRAPLYESENAGYLMQDWPRIPLPATRELLETSAALGRTVGDLLRPDVAFSPSAAERSLAIPRRVDGGQLTDNDLRVTVRYNGVGRYETPVTEGPTLRPSRLWWNDVAHWENVPPEVWAYTIGGYPVVKKWLDYRHIEKLKRPLTLDEVRYVSEMVRRIAALIALGPALDANYQAVKTNVLVVTVAPVTTSVSSLES
jgi:hypothetical protein